MDTTVLNTSYKAHALLGLLIGVWLVVFQVLISPFDVADLTFKNKLILIPPYGLLVFICYMFGVFIQNKWYAKDLHWNTKREGVVLIVVFLSLLPLCYGYYKTPMVRGDYTFTDFSITEGQ